MERIGSGGPFGIKCGSLDVSMVVDVVHDPLGHCGDGDGDEYPRDHSHEPCEIHLPLSHDIVNAPPGQDGDVEGQPHGQRREQEGEDDERCVGADIVEDPPQRLFVVHFLASTGARISELIQIKVEHIKLGYLDLYTKGGKLRRIYIPKLLREEALSWLSNKKQDSGFVFLNRYGERITTRGISGQLKKYAIKYEINPAVIYPHSFRHRFAKSFLERYNDIAFLADLMGHESIETTRIYLRKTSTEQRELVDMIIDW